MKAITSVLLIILCSGIPKISAAQSITSYNKIKDSLAILKDVGAIIDGFEPDLTPAEKRLYEIINQIYALPYNDMKILLTDPSPILRTYGFLMMCKKYVDKVSNSDKLIFADTARLYFYRRKGNVDNGLIVGQYCKMIYELGLEEKAMMDKEPKIKDVIKSFIQKNAAHPESYKPKSFSDYSFGGADDKSFYEIKHTYSIKKRDGKVVDATDYFIFGDDLQVTLIETNRSNRMGGGYPPEITEWMNAYGRKK